MGKVIAGAVIMGRHTYDMADPFVWANDDYEFQTPIYVLAQAPLNSALMRGFAKSYR
jgi:hypothetical protein